ncbi:MAG: ABC-F family ATP-binding cassette domain-containing protein, partial [Bacteroidia bacterium]
GQLEHDGILKRGHNVNIGYFAQNQDELLNDEMTVFETVDYIARGDIRTRLRDILGAFLFGGDDIDKKVKVLSGGERSRLAIVQLLLEPFNLLLLDEPTNHLDIRSKEILKKALVKFDGTLIVVSHDRDFLDGLVTKVFEFRNRKIRTYLGGISDFLASRKIESLKELEKKETKETRPAREAKPVSEKKENKEISYTAKTKEKKQSRTSEAVVAVTIESKPDSKMKYLEKKETERVYRRLVKQVEESEASITELEKEIAVMDSKLASGDAAVVNDTNFYSVYEERKQKLDAMLMQWEKVHTELEEFTSDYMKQDDHS